MTHRKFVLLLGTLSLILLFIFYVLILLLFLLIFKLSNKNKLCNKIILKLSKIKNLKVIISLYFPAFISVIWIVILVLLYINPVDKYFFKFDSVEDAFKYYYPEESIHNVIEKDGYYFIESKSTSFLAQQKDDEWLIKYANLSYKKEGDLLIFVHEVKGKDLYYILISATNDNEEMPSVTDTLNSTFSNYSFPYSDINIYSHNFMTVIKLSKEELDNYYLYYNDEKINVFENLK